MEDDLFCTWPRGEEELGTFSVHDDKRHDIFGPSRKVPQNLRTKRPKKTKSATTISIHQGNREARQSLMKLKNMDPNSYAKVQWGGSKEEENSWRHLVTKSGKFVARRGKLYGLTKTNSCRAYYHDNVTNCR